MTLKEFISLKIGDFLIFQHPSSPVGLLTKAEIQDKKSLCIQMNDEWFHVQKIAIHHIDNNSNLVIKSEEIDNEFST